MKKIIGFVVVAAVLLLSLGFMGTGYAADVGVGKRILFVPLDNRPITDRETWEVAAKLGYEMVIPPEELLGSVDRHGDPDGLWEWLRANAPGAKAAVVSTDAMLYGSLVGSRQHNFSAEKIMERAQKFQQLHENFPYLPIYALGTIMRTPTYTGSSAEPEYYKKYGQMIFNYTALKDKAETEKLSSGEKKKLANFEKEIPQYALDDWFGRRERNYNANKFFIDLTRAGVFNYFLLGCAPISAVIFSVSREDIKRVKNFSGPESILMCSGASILFKLILLAAFWFFTGRNILFPDVHQMSMILQQLYGNNSELRQSVMQVLALFPYLMPTLLVVYASFETLINYSLCGKIIKKFSPSSKNFPPLLPEFKAWRFSNSLLLVLVCSFIASYFIKTDTWFSGAVFLMNLQIVINVFMFVQGLAVAFWIMDGFKLRRGTKIFICVILSIPFFWAWLIIMGMSDMALNLRERIKFRSQD